jgi:polynucleotide 5'-kinase involved in rRNA processing
MNRVVCPRIVYMDVDVSWLLRTFGDCQMMAQMITRSLLVFPLINKDFRVCLPLLASGHVASVNLNHQKCARAMMCPNPYRGSADTPNHTAVVGETSSGKSLLTKYLIDVHMRVYDSDAAPW